MSNLGTLWFGADIDLTALKQKINQGNQGILDALKINYDPKSYLDMVSDIKSRLAKENFEIKVTANTQNLFGQGTGGGSKGLGNIGNLSQQILDQQKSVNELIAKIAKLRAEYAKLGEYTTRGQEIKNILLPNLLSQLADERLVLQNLKATRTAYNQTQAESTKQKKAASEATKQLNSDHMRLNATLLGGIHVSTQLGSALSSVFAIDAARQFLWNIVEIGGQLEKQRISMGAILGDAARANELFDEIKTLAVKSPFGVVELDQYSKQLAAYGVEQSELFDMTKRLADISAGAGQDIGRLALALGHVKSATYLTGITLRQFSMNNIPMLKMLADYYSEVEKRAVSTAEVQQRISKRQVSYDDVIAQIKRMTDEGGMFYNMQEKISESVAAKWKNLKDSLDIMYGDLAESKLGDMLKSLAEILMGLTTKWRTLIPVIAAAAAAFGTCRTVTYAFNKGIIAQEKLLATQRMGLHESAIATSKYSVAQLRAIASMDTFSTRSRYLNRALLSLKLTFNGLAASARAMAASLVAAIPQMAIISGISALVGLWQENEAEMEKTKELGDHLFDRTQEGLKNLKEMLKETGILFRDQYGNISNLYDKVPGRFIIPDAKKIDSATMAKNIELWQEFIKNYSATPNLMLQAAYAIDENGKATKSLSEQYEYLGNSVKDVAESIPLIGKFGEYLSEAIQESDGGVFDDNLLEDMKDYEDEVRKYKRYAQDLYREQKKEVVAAVDAAMANTEFAKAVEEAGIRSEDYAEKLSLLSMNSEKFKDASKAASEAWRSLTGTNLFKKGDIRMQERRLDEEFKQVAERLKNKLELKGVKIGELREPERLALTQVFTDMASKAGVSIDEVKKKVWDLVTTEFPGIKIDIDDVELAAKTSAMKEELNKLVGGTFHIDIKTATNAFDVIKSIREGYKSAKDAIENAKPILMKLGLEASGMALMTDEAIEQYSKGSEFVKSILTGVRDAQRQVNDALTASNNFGFSLTDPNKGGKVFRDSNKKTSDAVLKQWKEQLKELENFYKVYKRNVEYMSKDDAIQKALSTGFFNIDKDVIDNIDDYLKVLQDFRKKVEAKMGKKPSTERKSFLTDLLTKIDEKEFEVNVKKATENAVKQINRMLDEEGKKWDVYKRILDATGNRRQASLIAFGDLIDFSNFAEQLRNEIAEATKGTGKSVDELLVLDDDSLQQLGIFKNNVNGVYQMLEKLRYAEQSVKMEEVDLFLDALENAKSLETEMDKIATKYQRTREAIIKNNKLSQEEKDALLLNVDQNQAREEANTQWEWFKKNTEGWGEMFGNMDRMTTQAIQDMIRNLESFIPKVQGSEEAIKAVYEALEKMRDALHERNPFKAMADSLKEISKYRSAIEAVRKMFPGIGDNEMIGLDAKTAGKLGLTDGSTGWNGTINQIIAALNAAEDTLTKSISNIANVFGALQDVLQPVIDLFETLGNTTLSKIFQAGSNALGAAASVAGGMNQLKGLFKEGSGISNFLGSAGLYGAAAAAGLSIVTSLFAMHDEALQEEIEASQARQKEMETMTKNLEKALSRTLGGIYNTTLSESAKALLNSRRDSIRRNAIVKGGLGLDSSAERAAAKEIDDLLAGNDYYKAQKYALEAQRDELERQMKLEEDKKNSDQEKLADYRQQIAEMEDDIKNFALDMANSLWDIDLKSWASQLTDAVVDAWDKGEDAAVAYTDKVKSLMKDLTKNILAQKVLEQAFKNAGLDELIARLMDEQSGKLNYDAIPQIAEVLGNAGESAVTAVTAVLDEMEAKGLISKGEGGSSTASKVIQGGFTENETGLLLSYVNAIRADVSIQRFDVGEIRLYMEQIAQRQNVIAEAQTQQLRQIADNTSRNADAAADIYRLLQMATRDKSFGFIVR